MQKIKFIAIIAGMMLCLSGVSAQKAEKQCTITGAWTTAKSKGKISWKVKLTWSNGENNNAFGFGVQQAGTTKDQFGDFTLTGGCSEGFCNFTQNYSQGKFKGRTYSYVSGYSTLNPLKVSGSYERLEGENKISEGNFTLDKMTCTK